MKTAAQNVMVYSLLLIFFLFSSPRVSAQEIAGDFDMTAFVFNRQDLSKGRFWFSFKDSTSLVEITEPVHQLITFKQNKTVIYYPEDEKAFEYPADLTKPSSFLLCLLIAKTQELNSAPGEFLKQVKNEKDADGFNRYEVWEKEIKEGKQKKTVQIEVKRTKDNLISEILTKEKKGELFSKISFKKYVPVSEWFFPTEFRNKLYPQDELTILNFKNLRLFSITGQVKNRFKIPKTVKIKKF